MITRTTHPKPQPTSIQTKTVTLRHASQLAKAAQHIMSASQRRAYEQGQRDFENSTQDHPPYGFSDLQQAWKAGWLAAKQKAEGLNGGSRAPGNARSA
jgi:hypothetical protein